MRRNSSEDLFIYLCLSATKERRKELKQTYLGNLFLGFVSLLSFATSPNGYHVLGLLCHLQGLLVTT